MEEGRELSDLQEHFAAHRGHPQDFGEEDGGTFVFEIFQLIIQKIFKGCANRRYVARFQILP